MARKPEATSIPPDTGAIDTDWGDKSSVVDTNGADGTERPTAMPPDEYESFARRATKDPMTSEETRRALSAPSVPVIDVGDYIDLVESGELEAPIPMLGQQPSGPYAIPLELGDDGENLHPSDRPTTPQLEPPPEFHASIPTPRPTPKVKDNDFRVWRDEATTPVAASPDVLHALRKPSSPGRPAIRTRALPEDPVVSFGEEVLDLDEPGSISMEDSLEISLDNIPPAPFDFTPRDERRGKEESRQRDSLELLLEGAGNALDLVEARATPLAPDPGDDDPLVDLRDRYAVGDFTGAHEIAEAILADDPNNSEALRFRESCRDVLIQMYTARLGSIDQVPRLAIPTAELQWLSLDHRAGFLLSCVDGRSTVEEILDVSGMPKLDALRILYTLLQQQIIDVRG